jgi:hypothetical protein
VGELDGRGCLAVVDERGEAALAVAAADDLDTLGGRGRLEGTGT